MKIILFLLTSFMAFAHDGEHHYHEELTEIGPDGEKIFSKQVTFPLNKRGNIDQVRANTLYLTIDDGPTPGVTNRILDTLKKHRIRATFFVIGKKAKRYQKLMKRMRDEGHLIGNHTENHELSFKNRKHFYQSLLNTHNILEPYYQKKQILLFRAPGGVWNDWRAKIGNDHLVLRDYVGPIYWNVGGGSRANKDDADWKCWRNKVSIKGCTENYYQQIIRRYQKGSASLILTHDIKKNSAELIRHLINKLELDPINWKYDVVENIPRVIDGP